jgi:hypothetical protein
MQRSREVRITEALRKEIASIVDERIREVRVTREDFSELRTIVRELAEAQKRTEQRVEELAEAQKRTEQRVEELAEAQKRTEQRVEELAEAQKRTEEEIRILASGQREIRAELGGLSRTMSYAFENEAFRMLPSLLKERFNIELSQRLIREEIRGKEINIFGRGRRDGEEILIIGEAKLRLDERRENIEEIFHELEEKEKAAKEEYGEKETFKILVTHFATRGSLRRAAERGILVVQSFEW